MNLEEKDSFKVSRTRLAAGAATVALAAGGIGVGFVSAGASTTACNNATGDLAGSCGDLANGSGYGLAVQTPTHGRVGAGDQIVSISALTTSKTTDFYVTQTNGNDNERVLEYAPSAEVSGLCVTQTSPGGGLQWLNAATGRVIDITKRGVTTEELASSSNNNSTYVHWVQ